MNFNTLGTGNVKDSHRRKINLAGRPLGLSKSEDGRIHGPGARGFGGGKGNKMEGWTRCTTCGGLGQI